MTWFDTEYPTPEARQQVIDQLNTTGQAHLDYAEGDHGFGVFLAADQLCLEQNTVSIHDLPDYTWRDWFDAGMTPQQAVDAALKTSRADH